MKHDNASNNKPNDGQDTFSPSVFDDEVSRANIPTHSPWRSPHERLHRRERFPQQRTRTSVDTIHLQGEFEIVGQLSPNVLVEHSYKQRQDVFLYTEEDGERPIHYLGRRAKACKNGIHVLIEPLYEGSQEVVCKVAFSAPKVLYGTNEHILSAQECKQVFDRVEETLLGWGIKMNVQDATIVEVHVLRHLEMNRPATCHVNLLHYLTIKHSSHTVNYPTGILRGNESNQLGIYDKGAEMKDKKRDPRQIVPISHEHQQLLEKLEAETILRVEWRLRNASIVRRELGTYTPRDLLLYFECLDPWLSKKLKTNLFREKVPYDVEDLIGKPPLDKPTFRQRSEFLANMLGGTGLAIKRMMMFEALERRMQTYGKECVPDLRNLHSGSKGGENFSRLQTELRKIMLMGLSSDGIPNAVLYAELQQAANALPRANHLHGTHRRSQQRPQRLRRR